MVMMGSLAVFGRLSTLSESSTLSLFCEGH
jgi:hypothetical protein